MDNFRNYVPHCWKFDPYVMKMCLYFRYNIKATLLRNLPKSFTQKSWQFNVLFIFLDTLKLR